MVCHIGLETKDMTHTEKGIRHVEDPSGKCLDEYGIEHVALDAFYAMKANEHAECQAHLSNSTLHNIKRFKCL